MFSFIADMKKKANLSKLKDESFRFLFDEDKSGEVVVIDTETTGLDVQKDEILSIGAVKIKENRILTSETFEVFLQNSKEIAKESIKVHKIRPFDLRDAKTAKEGIVEFLNFVGSRPLVGYYLEFDVAMINKYTKEILGITLPNRTTEVSEIYFDKTISLIPQGNIDLRFDTILKNCDIPNMGAHNAVNDAIMTAMIYLKLTQGDKK